MKGKLTRIESAPREGGHPWPLDTEMNIEYSNAPLVGERFLMMRENYRGGITSVVTSLKREGSTYYFRTANSTYKLITELH